MEDRRVLAHGAMGTPVARTIHARLTPNEFTPMRWCNNRYRKTDYSVCISVYDELFVLPVTNSILEGVRPQ
jgi:hypothetical protein